MRFLLVLLSCLLVAPALAATHSETYENSRFGYVIGVPAGFLGEGESQSGDGQVFRSESGTASLHVWGGHILDGSFEDAMQAAIDYASEDGWRLGEQIVTPSWASYAGTRNGLMLHARVIALCGGSQFAAFALEYPERDLRSMDAVAERLAASLAATGTGYECPTA
ncbi:MAG TPA: hypothetical protein VGN80_13600 [Devosiaceae bacterium]|jgi:hypothetical protein|nr:hypothetical protein [Devosiaceae bacterium]